MRRRRMIDLVAVCLAVTFLAPASVVVAASDSGPYAPSPSLGSAPSADDWYAQIGGGPVRGAIDRGAFTGALSPAAPTNAADASVRAGVGLPASSWWQFLLIALLALGARWRFGHSRAVRGDGRSA